MYRINVSTGEHTIVGYLPADLLTLPSCGLATKSDGSKVVVVAGGSFNANEGITDSYILDLEQNIFLPGPPLPQPRTWARAVQYGNSFIIVGGADSGFEPIAYEDMLYYNPDDEAWEVLPQKLPYPDYVNGAVLVPDDFVVNC